MLALAGQEPSARVLVLLKKAYERCGDGYGFLAATAQLEFDRGNLPATLEALSREMLAPRSSDRASALALQLVEQFPAARRALQEVGKTAEAPVHVRSVLMARGPWMREVSCGGQDPRAVNMAYPSKQHPELYSPALYTVGVECPGGDTHVVYFWQDGASWPSPPPFSFDRPMPEVSAVLGWVKDKFGISTAAELRTELLDPTPSRSHAWLLSHVWDLPEEIRVWGQLLEEDKDDLEALFFRSQEQAAIGDLDGAVQTLAHASRDSATA